MSNNHGRFGPDVSAPDFLAWDVSASGRFGLLWRLDAGISIGLHCWLRMHLRRDCMFVAVPDPGVRRLAVVRSRSEWTHMHSFAPRTTARRRTPGSRTATSSWAGCPEPAVY